MSDAFGFVCLVYAQAAVNVQILLAVGSVQ